MSSPDLTQVALILLAGFGGGAINAIAGGGTNLTFPALLWLGVAPVEANVTSAIALWPGGISGAWGFRRQLREVQRIWLWLAVPSVVGGVLGAWLLVHTPPTLFRSVAPALILGSSLLIAAQPRLRRMLDLDPGGSPAVLLAALTAQLLIATYGGYFGSGIGLLMLVTLGLSGVHYIHHANALKNLLGVLIKGAAVLFFALSGPVVWMIALIMGGAAVVGGYAGARLAQRVPETSMRWTIAAFGITVATLMLVEEWTR